MGLVFLVFAVAGTLGALTDWLFMGVLFHSAYNRYPEVWREGVREGRSRSAILWAVALGYVMTAAVMALAWLAGVHRIREGLIIGALAWLAGPPTVIIVTNMFVKMDCRITFAHCAGYAARMLIAGAAAGLLFGRLAPDL
jgi:hypothetical protein